MTIRQRMVGTGFRMLLVEMTLTDLGVLTKLVDAQPTGQPVPRSARQAPRNMVFIFTDDQR
ncbi:MAG: hypothetical protein VYE68_08850, partial [Acidobacteriota bacterium]|nr:hypothetical protein [Acidobacteriota bacterium]